MKHTPVLFALAGMMMFLFAACVDEEITPDPNPSDSTAAGSIPEGFVDLGLPSGLLWAECNLGANAPEDYGNYYAWGETEPKSDYSWTTYPYANGNYDQLTKYCFDASYGYDGFTDGLTTLQAMDDAVMQTLGNGTRIPTKAEWEELLNNTTSTWTTHNGVNGRLLTAPNGNSIFLPAAGYHWDSECRYEDTNGHYWSSTLHTDFQFCAWSCYFNSDGQNMDNGSRNSGFPVRAVHPADSTGSDTPAPSPCTPTYGDTTASAVGSFTWRGTSYTASGNYTSTLTNAAGCDSILTLHLTITPEPDPVSWVDLGLPSGMLWASCNLGATTPEGYGNYYAWGETTTKSDYSWANYRYCNGSNNTLTKYCSSSSYGYNGYTDALTTLEAIDDAATQALGSGARTPTKAEWEELMNNTTATWTTLNGVYGRRFTAPNGNSLFLPAAGSRYSSALNLAGTDGYYWSSSLYTDCCPDFAWYFKFYSDYQQYMSDIFRCNGYSVRPVRSAR